MTQDELHPRIARAAQEGWTELDLHNQDVTELAPEIARLTSLTELHLSGNQLTAVPPRWQPAPGVGGWGRGASAVVGNGTP